MWSVSVCLLHLESGVDHAVGLHGGDGDVEHPEEDECWWWDGLEELGSTQLSTNGRMSSGKKDKDGKQSLNTEHGHREAQAARMEDFTYVPMLSIRL